MSFCYFRNISMGSFYILKVKGTDKIPDYVQLRDESFSLLAYFRADRPDKALEKAGLSKYSKEIMAKVITMEFGDIEPFEFV